MQSGSAMNRTGHASLRWLGKALMGIMCQFFCQNLLFMTQAFRKWNNIRGNRAPFFRKWVRTLIYSTLSLLSIRKYFTRTWVWGLVLRLCVRSVRVWNVRGTSSVKILCPSCSISHKISKSDSNGGEPVICDSAQHTTWVALPPPSPTTNNASTRCPQQITQYLSTGTKRKNLKKNNLVEHIKLIMGGWVGTTKFTQSSRLPWMIRN